MEKRIEPKIYSYTKNGLVICKVKLNTAIVFNKFPEYAVSSNIYSVYYEQGSSINCIKYKDGSTKELSKYEPYYEEQFTKVYAFEFECKEHIAKEKIKANQPPEFKIFVSTIMAESDIQKRYELKKEYELERGSTQILTDEYIVNYLNGYKKTRLSASDWTQTLDIQAKMSDELKKEWIEYRETLRTLDKIEDPMQNVFLPTAPANPS